jgi:dTMP kinase
MKQGLFITLEGADGSGKTTQMDKIVQFFEQNNIEYIVTREPGGMDLGHKIRDILLNYDGEVDSTCEMFLYLADRAQHMQTKIKKALAQGKVVLCDRHTDSTLAYQGYARGLDIDEINLLNNIATRGKKPDLTLLFDVDTEVAMERVGNRAEKDRLEAEGAKFHQKVRNGYLEIEKKEPERIKIINSNLDIDSVWAQVESILKEKF